MYSKQELIENEKLLKAIRENHNKKQDIIKTLEPKLSILDYILLTLATGTFVFGLLFLISVIENARW